MSISNLHNEVNFNYNLGNSALERVSSTRDLGVVVDNKLTFNKHIDEVVKASLKTLGFIIRSTKDFVNLESLITLYNSLIKSKLLYAAMVWFPNYEVHIDRLEYVQRKFLKYLSFKLDGIYPPRGCDHNLLLQRFNFLSLKHCVILSSQLFLFKLCCNKIDAPDLLCELNFFVPPIHTRKPVQFYLENTRTNLTRNAPLYRACSWFNTLNSEHNIDLFNGSITAFKKRVIQSLSSL